ncbi:MAG: UPF0182 family protein, partial [Planctomycetes bacterium]|nr:UPF0182 family protein [Planctomycetota bacterium]
MYALLLIALAVLGVFLLGRGVSAKSPAQAFAGAAVLLATAALFGLLSFLAEMLWFDALGYSRRFWTVVWTKIGLAAAAAVFGAVLVWLLFWPARGRPFTVRIWPELAGGIIGAVWGYGNWDTALRFRHAAETGVTDPILGQDVGFYLFRLPMYEASYWLILPLTVVAWIAAALSMARPHVPRSERQFHVRRLEDWNRVVHWDVRPNWAWCWPAGVLALTLAGGQWINVYNLMYSPWGAVFGAGWTDVTIRLPAYYVLAAILALVGAAWITAGMFRALQRRLERRRTLFISGSVAAPVAVWALGLVVLPALVQWLRVQPNEITLERPYIAHNIRFTRQGFQLDKVEEKEFPVTGRFTREIAQNNSRLLNEIRLWDPRALAAVYQQFQEIRLYYEFPDVDIDRYTIDGAQRQVIVSPRELELNNLPPQSQTFVNRHFKYTHGYGLTMAPVSEFTSSGLPNLLVKNLPPVSEKREVT